MKFGFVVPWADAAEIGELAAVAELHGWDGLFVWEPVWGVDAWVVAGRGRVPHDDDPPRHDADAAAAAQAVGAGRPGRHRRPAVGRTGDVVSVGLGAPDSGYAAFGEETDRRMRAELLDEGLASCAGCGRASRSATTASTTTIDAERLPGDRPHRAAARRADLVRRRARLEEVDDAGAARATA